MIKLFRPRSVLCAALRSLVVKFFLQSEGSWFAWLLAIAGLGFCPPLLVFFEAVVAFSCPAGSPFLALAFAFGARALAAFAGAFFSLVLRTTFLFSAGAFASSFFCV